MSPALAGRFFTTEPPGKPTHCMILIMGCSRKGKTMETVKKSTGAEGYGLGKGRQMNSLSTKDLQGGGMNLIL